MQSKIYYSQVVADLQASIAAKSSELDSLRGKLDQALNRMNMAPAQEAMEVEKAAVKPVAARSQVGKK